ncbi:WD domain G-beta repeat family protein [Babesia bovis T2Bo]|uniref:Uncharacterized protein n=1 Tax=Babesia bovis TaxID=5865 RepID=A7ARP3_BABBO|nr:WD domain G-beta repeat family protein [Babesia bovis T2Bo]EDO07212.1 WD domain G-beta repeat family protein [Babesia bovis T2Bo]|eukprot:XP_001610780.1 hypothetical protein [Babesia bovis T2Bo]
MKGYGLFSPFASTTGSILLAPCYDENSGIGSPHLSSNEKVLKLLGFEIKEQKETTGNIFDLHFDSSINYNAFGNDNPFTNPNDEFGDYGHSNSSVGIGVFTTYHSVDAGCFDGHLSAIVWMEMTGAHGMIAIGTTEGDVYLLDGNAIAEGDAARVISKTKVCNTPIKRLSYNAKTNMLAVASVDGQISVCELTNPSEPKVIDTSYGKWRVGLVTGLSWNHRLGHILATSGSAVGPSGAMSPSDSSGLVVWDLKARKPASSFRDPSGRTNPIAVEWMAEQMTQLVVGYGDDRSPALQLWDLRNCSVPLKEVRGHTMGLTSLAICPQDPNILITSGRDDHTRCWTLDATKGPFHAISSMQTGALSHHKRVQWHPHVPGLFLAQNTDDDISVHNVMCMTQEESYMPSWVRNTSGVISGFAASVTTWNAAGAIKEYTLSTNVDEETSKALDDSLQLFCNLADSKDLESVCEQRISSAENEFERLTWSMMHAIHKGNAEAIVTTLGFKMPEPQLESNISAASQQIASGQIGQPDITGFNDPFSSTPLNDDDGEAFFNSLSSKTNENSVEFVGQSPSTEEDTLTIQGEPMRIVEPSSYLNWGEDDLCSKVVVGDFEGAASLCLERGRTTEALFLAYVGGIDLWLKVAADITNKMDNPLLRTLHLIMKDETHMIVEQCPLDRWREALVYIITNSMDVHETYSELCRILGNRLYTSFQQGNREHVLPASILFMCSGDVSRVLECWEHLEKGKNALHILGESVIRTTALSLSIPGNTSTDCVGRKAVMLAETFVEFGDLNKAVQCLSLPLISGCPQVISLLGRIKGMGSYVPPDQPVANIHRQIPSSPAQPAPRTTGDYKTAPGAVAGAMYPGMPVPWPLPTATQQKVSRTRSTEDANRKIIAKSAAALPQQERMKPADLEFATKVLGSLISQADTTRAAQDNRRRIAELMSSLENGEQSVEANNLILTMCRAIHSGDHVNANIILSTISTKLWNTANKNWIMCLKRIVPR